MFAIKLYLFSIGTITLPIHTELVPKPIFILDIIMAELVLKQPMTPVDVLTMKLTIPPNIVKQHLLETFFHPEVGEMIVDVTFAQEQIQDLTMASWIVTEEEHLIKVNLGTKKNMQ
jgi:hypothetical protein